MNCPFMCCIASWSKHFLFALVYLIRGQFLFLLMNFVCRRKQVFVCMCIKNVVSSKHLLLNQTILFGFSFVYFFFFSIFSLQNDTEDFVTTINETGLSVFTWYFEKSEVIIQKKKQKIGPCHKN